MSLALPIVMPKGCTMLEPSILKSAVSKVRYLKGNVLTDHRLWYFNCLNGSRGNDERLLNELYRQFFRSLRWTESSLTLLEWKESSPRPINRSWSVRIWLFRLLHVRAAITGGFSQSRLTRQQGRNKRSCFGQLRYRDRWSKCHNSCVVYFSMQKRWILDGRN